MDGFGADKPWLVPDASLDSRGMLEVFWTRVPDQHHSLALKACTTLLGIRYTFQQNEESPCSNIHLIHLCYLSSQYLQLAGRE